MIHTTGKINSFLELEFLKIKSVMKKNLPITLFLFLFSYLTYSQSFGIMYSDVNSRRTPSGEKLRVISKGQLIEILQNQRSWSFVKDLSNDKKGWVSTKYIKKNIAVLKSDANSRRTAGGKKLRVISKGQLVEVLQYSGGWSFVKDLSNDKKGWVANSVLSSNLNSSPKSKPIIVKKEKNIPPNCDYIITSPSNGDQNVNINPTIIKWKHGSGSPEGYYFSIATKINGNYNYVITKQNKKVKKLKIGNVNSYSVSNLKANTKYFIGLIPYNDIGLGDCDGMFSFTTGNGSSNNNNVASSEQIIENRLREMGLKWKWDSFKKGINNKKINVSNVTDFLLEVKSYMGVPYKFNGTTRSGIDCSGLIWKGLRATGYNGERLNAQSLAQSGRLIANKSSLRPGDLVCFTNTTGANKLVQHIAVYVGNNQFLHAPSSGKNVMLSDINDRFYWGNKFIFGVRY